MTVDAAVLSRELLLLEPVIGDRLGECLDGRSVQALDEYGFDRGQFAEFNDGLELTADEHVVMLLALAPHVRPALFGRVIGRVLPEGGDLPQFGGVRGEHHRGVLPTGETAQFVLAGEDLAGRLAVQRLLSSEHWFARRQVLWLDAVREGEPAMSGRLILGAEIVETLTTGSVSRPRF